MTNPIMFIEDNTAFLYDWADVSIVIDALLRGFPDASCRNSSSSGIKSIEIEFPDGRPIPDRFQNFGRLGHDIADLNASKGWPIVLSAKEEETKEKEEAKKRAFAEKRKSLLKKKTAERKAKRAAQA